MASMTMATHLMLRKRRIGIRGYSTLEKPSQKQNAIMVQPPTTMGAMTWADFHGYRVPP